MSHKQRIRKLEKIRKEIQRAAEPEQPMIGTVRRCAGGDHYLEPMPEGAIRPRILIIRPPSGQYCVECLGKGVAS